jgi:hypothetical protein
MHEQARREAVPARPEIDTEGHPHLLALRLVVSGRPSCVWIVTAGGGRYACLRKAIPAMSVLPPATASSRSDSVKEPERDGTKRRYSYFTGLMTESAGLQASESDVCADVRSTMPDNQATAPTMRTWSGTIRRDPTGVGRRKDGRGSRPRWFLRRLRHVRGGRLRRCPRCRSTPRPRPVWRRPRFAQPARQ